MAANERLVESTPLARVIASLQPTLPRQEVFARALQGALHLTRADRGTLLLPTPDRRALELRAVAGHTMEAFRCDSRRGIAGACFTSGQPLVIPDARLDPRFNPDIDSMTGYTTRSVLAMPLLCPEGAVLGVVEVLCSTPGRFSQADAETLACLCPHIVLALSTIEHVRRARQEVALLDPAEVGLIGESKPFLDMLSNAMKYASTDHNILITGESGSGKELVARLIHRASARCGRTFAGVNCATIPEQLAESLLFGHRKGAFSGATSDVDGLFGTANGGTIFLDEVGELYPAVQAKLLRVLQEKAYCRVGEWTPRPTDVRILSATNRPVHPFAEGALLRPELYARLAMFRLEVPPCRRRGDDPLLIFKHLIRKTLGSDVRVSEEVRKLFASHPWPLNVREVESAAEHAALLARGEKEVRVEHVLGGLITPPRQDLVLPPWFLAGTWDECVDRFEGELARHALKLCGGNKSKVSRELKVSRRELGRICRRLDSAS